MRPLGAKSLLVEKVPRYLDTDSRISCEFVFNRMLHTLASQKSGCLFLRKQPTVEPSLKV